MFNLLYRKLGWIPLLVWLAAMLFISCGDDLKEKAMPQIKIDPTSLEFPPVPVGSQLQVQAFQISNESSDVALTIKRLALKTASPYLKMYFLNEYREEATDLQIDKNGLIQVDIHYDPQSQDLGCHAPPTEAELPENCTPPSWSPHYCGHLIVESNDPNDSCLIVPIDILQSQGLIEVSVPESDALKMTFRPAVVGDPPQEAYFRIENAGQGELHLNGVEIHMEPASAFSVFPSQGGSSIARLAPGAVADYTVKLEAVDENVGAGTGTVVIQSDDATKPVVNILIQVGNPGGAAMELSTHELTFVDIAQGSSDEQSITVTNNGDGAPLVLTLALDPATTGDYSVFNGPSDQGGEPMLGAICASGASCNKNLTILQSQSQTIYVKYAPQSNTPTDAKLIFRGVDIEAQEVVLNASGHAGQGHLSISPNPLVINGPVIEGTTAVGTLTLGNDSNVNIQVQNMTQSSLNPGSCELFEISPAPDSDNPLDLAVGQSIQLTVTYHRPEEDPEEVAHQCDLTFSYQDEQGFSGESIATIQVQY